MDNNTKESEKNRIYVKVGTLSAVILVVIILAVLFARGRQFPLTPNGAIVGKPATIVSDTTVTVSANGFTPKTVTIRKGGRVIWVNSNAGKASVNSDNYPTNTLYPALNLGAFNSGSSVQLVFPSAGTYSYHNQFNPKQTGTVTVQ